MTERTLFVGHHLRFKALKNKPNLMIICATKTNIHAQDVCSIKMGSLTCGFPRGLWQRGCVNWTCLSVSVVCVCVYSKKLEIDWQPPPPPPRLIPESILSLALSSLRSEGVLATACRVEPLSNTPLIYSRWCTRKKIAQGLREGVRDAFPALLFEENMAYTRAWPSPDSSWQKFHGTNSGYHSTEAKAPTVHSLNRCGGSVV